MVDEFPSFDEVSEKVKKKPEKKPASADFDLPAPPKETPKKAPPKIVPPMPPKAAPAPPKIVPPMPPKKAPAPPKPVKAAPAPPTPPKKPEAPKPIPNITAPAKKVKEKKPKKIKKPKKPKKKKAKKAKKRAVSAPRKPKKPEAVMEMQAVKPQKPLISDKVGKVPSIQLVTERDIAADFATKVYLKFDKIIKSIVLFGSQNKDTATSSSDIDIIMIVDDASIKWDDELIAWYREELAKIIQNNPYKKSLHINSVRLTTWWKDLTRGDPVVVNVIRYGEPLIDFGGFFNPLKVMLERGDIKSTPESIYTALQRAPSHLSRSRAAKLSSIEGLYWAMVDSSHALLMTAKQSPPSPEHIPIMLKEMFVDTNNLKMKYVVWYRDLYILHRKIMHGSVLDVKGEEIDEWQKKADEFVRVMTALIKKMIE
ncbi:MAG: nucleotidyltransferase domain-containing protein [archaeon]